MSGKRGVMNAILYKLLKKKKNHMCTMVMYYCHLYL